MFVPHHTNKICLLTIQQSFLNELHDANHFNNGFVRLQGASYYKKKNNFTFRPGKSQENFINIFLDFPFQDLQTKFKDFPGQRKKKSRTFPGCGNPGQ